MYHVQFPGLGINVTLDPIAFKIGNHPIAWYGIIIATGFLLAFLYALQSCKKFRVDPDRFVDVVMVGIIFGVIGARLYYVLFDSSSQYIENPISVFYIWNGGLGIYGGIIGGLLFGSLMAKLRKLSIPAVLDLASLGFLIGQCIGRWGNFVNQEAFGTGTNLPWRMISENTDLVSAAGVHPCFLYESFWCLLGFILLHIFSRKYRRYDGQVFLLYTLWYGVGRFFIEGLRTDSLITPVIPLRVSQVVAAAAVIAAIVLLIVFRNRTVLTGCGSRKIMELNSIVDEVKPEEIEETYTDDGTSTIFDSAEQARTYMNEESETADQTESDSEDKPQDAPAADASLQDEKAGGEETKDGEAD
ncbi:Prolipoprotein diacylglyceryl transferase [Caprobacter fermentans]|uniref:Phosphatidylglycerol--prolipoprotein diacylglyceryl transferase n=1 Tax=Caproicibacter fermentans TaxID=2576756 RepID=A0A6N8I1F0_9FIRM|nr:prolipoprotein diacylglyceryl transferase [Caproicibacter fermentans]MVB11941.1 Prolipoprotein diacylglyceryl transferase [Caproicibacter fermentans]OCM99830.1 prolipoprotein diacylglyceryl transferase [Clostridium sp. W14A]